MLLSVSVMNSGVKLFNWLAVPNYLNYITQGSIIKYQKHSTWNDKYMSIHIFTTKLNRMCNFHIEFTQKANFTIQSRFNYISLFNAKGSNIFCPAN